MSARHKRRTLAAYREQQQQREREEYGPCCGCGERLWKYADAEPGGPTITLMMLPFLAPVPGTGWGCFVCGLASDGACAVLCDNCAGRAYTMAEPLDVIKWVPIGYAKEGERLPIEQFARIPFGHDISRHPELQEAGITVSENAGEKGPNSA